MESDQGFTRQTRTHVTARKDERQGNRHRPGPVEDQPTENEPHVRGFQLDTYRTRSGAMHESADVRIHQTPASRFDFLQTTVFATHKILSVGHSHD